MFPCQQPFCILRNTSPALVKHRLRVSKVASIRTCLLSITLICLHKVCEEVVQCPLFTERSFWSVCGAVLVWRCVIQLLSHIFQGISTLSIFLTTKSSICGELGGRAGLLWESAQPPTPLFEPQVKVPYVIILSSDFGIHLTDPLYNTTAYLRVHLPCKWHKGRTLHLLSTGGSSDNLFLVRSNPELVGCTSCCCSSFLWRGITGDIILL